MNQDDIYGGDIDAVYLWVGSDSAAFRDSHGQALRNTTGLTSDSTGMHRFRDNGELRYSLRSLARHAPWIRRIHVVTNGECPSWLVADSRLTIVTHDSIFTDADMLPTFNSAAIELQLHRIPGLSRYFLYFNDDLFLNAPVQRSDYFTTDGRQVFYFDDVEFPADDTGTVNDSALVNTRRVLAGHGDYQVNRFLPAHVPQVYDRQLIAHLEDSFRDAFEQTSRHRFRSRDDFLLRIAYSAHTGSRYGAYRKIAARHITSGSTSYSFVRLVADKAAMSRELFHVYRTKPKFLCLNDELGDDDESDYLRRILAAFMQQLHPASSRYERAPAGTGLATVPGNTYWDRRLENNWGLDGVGCLAYGRRYNEWLYRIRARGFLRVLRDLGVTDAQPRVLDVGCGTGFYLRLYSKLGLRGISGLDIASSALDRLRVELPGIDLHHADISAPLNGLGAQSYDLISAMDVLFHLVDDMAYRQALHNIHELLSPGGYFLFTENLLSCGERRHEDYWRARGRGDIEAMLLETGFTIIKTVPVFAVMNCPVDTKHAAVTRLWQILMGPVRKSELAGYLTGLLLYPVELIALPLMKQGPSTKLVICRKAGVMQSR